MAFNFEQVLNDALGKGIAVARTGGPQIEDWVRQSVQANRDSLASIAEGVVKKEISKETAEYLLKQNGRALQAEA